MRAALALVAVVLVAACSSSSTGEKPASSSRTQPVTPSAAGTANPSLAPVPEYAVGCQSPPAAGQRLVIVTLATTPGVVVRDITDIKHPITRCNIPGGGNFQFISATQLSYVRYLGDSWFGHEGALFRVDLKTGLTSRVRQWTDSRYLSWMYAWSPDGRTLAYLTSNSQGLEWHLASGGDDTMLARRNAIGLVSGWPEPMHPNAMIGFSADGAYVAMQESYSNSSTPLQVFRVADRSAVLSANGDWAIWSGGAAHLLYHDIQNHQVIEWTPTDTIQQQGLMPGLNWAQPSVSPDGLRVTYSDLHGTDYNTWVLDINVSGPNKETTAQPRFGSYFMTPTLVWQAAWNSSQSTVGTGYIYDLADGSEARSVITSVGDAWPHAVGQS